MGIHKTVTKMNNNRDHNSRNNSSLENISKLPKPQISFANLLLAQNTSNESAGGKLPQLGSLPSRESLKSGVSDSINDQMGENGADIFNMGTIGSGGDTPLTIRTVHPSDSSPPH